MRFLPTAVSLRGHTTDALPRFDRFFYVRSSSIMADPAYMQALKGEFGMMKYGWFRNYHAKYMVQGRFKPAIHLVTFVMCLGYFMEYPHLKRVCSLSHPAAHNMFPVHPTRATRVLLLGAMLLSWTVSPSRASPR